ncbi:Uma2 family endonuclease [Jiella sonneratiae]|uniref:Uma2 family endonuclease n=1 Tax=Jiella sonneratiae TaxID=2816856 RepID=A0ABS3IXS2_9HYPH|nr:Uma2 family endonuclease [Jiella sonneratiae]MBO0902191.1 Uma2 family endonuclease [Jiella sonneratiae]
MTIEAAQTDRMTAEAFFAWAATWGDGERYELVEGVPLRLQSERISHAETKFAVVAALKTALRDAGSDCSAFIDGIGVRVDEFTVREPDALVHCGPYDADDVFASNPVVVVEVVSPSSARTDTTRKLIDYFAVPSILHYLIVYGGDGRVIHHRRASSDGEIVTKILGRDGVLDLNPPGISIDVESFLGA